MINSIKLLEEQNAMHMNAGILSNQANTGTDLRNEIPVHPEMIGKKAFKTSMLNGVGTDEENKTKKVLVLCDEDGAYMGTGLRRILKAVSVQTIFKPGALFRNIIVDIIKLTKDFTLDDNVIIIGGSNDFNFNKKNSPF